MYADTSRPIISIPTKHRQPFFSSRRSCLASFLSRFVPILLRSCLASFLSCAVPVSRFFLPCAVCASCCFCLAFFVPRAVCALQFGCKGLPLTSADSTLEPSSQTVNHRE